MKVLEAIIKKKQKKNSLASRGMWKVLKDQNQNTTICKKYLFFPAQVVTFCSISFRTPSMHLSSPFSAGRG